ncbi:MAG: hypothetical protein ACTSRZ_07590 [Promethearchaeota archaeon]
MSKNASVLGEGVKSMPSMVIPKKFSPITILGLAIMFIGILIGNFVWGQTSLGYTISFFGALLLLFNSYMRHQLSTELSIEKGMKYKKTLMFPPKMLKIFFLILLGCNFAILKDVFILVLLAFKIALSLRILNVILHWVDIRETKKLIKWRIILLVICAGLVIYLNFGTLAYVIASGSPFIISWNVGNSVGIVLISGVMSFIIFPMITAFELELTETDLKFARKKFIISAIKILIPLVFLIILMQLMNQMVSIVIDFNLYLTIIPSLCLIILGFLTKER